MDRTEKETIGEFRTAFKYKVIYIFSINDEAHKGLVKIGDATLHTESPIDSLSPNCRELNQAALARIKSYTNTAGLTPILLYSELAVRNEKNDNDGTFQLKAFRDHDVHDVLENSGIHNVKIGKSTGSEWYDVDVETAKKAIDAVKKSYSNLSHTDTKHHSPIIFRPEQEDCIEKVVKHFTKEKADRFLINAKMRYGKTFVALEVIKRCKFKKTIIVTHRPVVNAGWYEDFTKIFYGENDYLYGSKANGNSIDRLLQLTDKNFVYFASVQDLRGSSEVGGKYEKNDTIFNTVWDCVIVDEAHEGTTTALGEDTISAIVKENLKKTKFLALSGTPFNILTDYDEKSIFTWDYVMEQENKTEWDKNHFGDSNPYEELPTLRIMTYDLGTVLKNSHYITYDDKAFNFHEFFRTWTTDYEIDQEPMPLTAVEGDFVHEKDILSFLNLLTKSDENSCYPYSNNEYRDLFRHTLWMVPGVKEARALKKLMLQHQIFGNGMFNIVNVAGNGDEEEKTEEALKKVKDAIKSAEKDGTYTITLSCGKLTTGVTVKEWTGVFMLAGSYSTSAANYLQTIFRVQSPCNKDGKIKDTAYVFDFAPDRTLKMVASAVSISSKAGKTSLSDKQLMGKFLNFCPVIAVSGSKMTEYSATRLLQQLKKAYADKVVRNGFDDASLYNDELLHLQDIDIKKFQNLKKIIGATKASNKTNDISVNDQGLSKEEHEKLEELKKKKKTELTPEEKAQLEELKRLKKSRANAISILRGISIRMPLLIYGVDVPYEEEVSIETFVDKVDDASWIEFMPAGVDKHLFKEFQKYYDEEVFIAAGRRIRNIAREADQLEPTERVKKIAGLFSYFKDPDKETVLTPWRVVNLHMSDCIGGWDFFDENHSKLLDSPRFVSQGKITSNIFKKDGTSILEINSKTGLYPLYVTYTIYREKLEKCTGQTSNKKRFDLWLDTVKNNIFVICKTKMAKYITQRTLLGYTDNKINAHYLDDLINMLKNKPVQFVNRVLKKSYWNKDGGDNMKFDAIVGNPPYQMEAGGAGRQSTPVYNLFVEQAKNLNTRYLSMITPSRWFSGGMGLDNFRDNMINDSKLVKLVDFTNAKDCFPRISISGGVSYFLWDKEYNGKCEVVNINSGKVNISTRAMNEFQVFVRYNEAIPILHKVLHNQAIPFSPITSIVSPLMPFGLSTNYRGKSNKSEDYCLTLHASTGDTYIKRSEVTKGTEYIDKYNVMMSKMSAEHAGEPNKDGKFNVFTKSMKVIGIDEVCTHSYFLIGSFDSQEYAENLLNYLKTKFVRFIIMTTLSAVNLSKLVFFNVPIQNFSESWSDDKLYKKYGLSESDIAYIDSLINPLD